MKYLQRLGRSLMLPVAALPISAILMGIGYWIDPTDWGGNNVVAAFLLKAGGAIIDNMGILFAIGVAVGMADDNDGTAAMAGLVSFLMIRTLLSPGSVAMITKVEVDLVNPAFSKITDGNQFMGILTGLIGSTCYNKFKNTKLPDALGFFSGKRSVAIVTGFVTIIVAVPLFFIWPVIYNALIAFGTFIISLGPVGAGLYGFFNRLLIPFGLHHPLNSVFWLDIAGINDIAKFWGTNPDGVLGQTGMYMTGFFPMMMFGLPAAAYAMYKRAKPENKKMVMALFMSAALASFFTGITEPLEFAFMFLAPALYLVHAVLTGIFVGVTAALPIRSGFNFSAGFVDWILSFKAPMALNPWLVPVLGIAAAIIYFAVFYFLIGKFDFKTPGREDEIDEDEKNLKLETSDFTGLALSILEGLGGAENIESFDNCITRLRVEVRDYTAVDEKMIKATGVSGVIRPGKNSVQVIVGMQVQHVADEMKKIMK